jgi:hypothetical protein
MQIEVKRLALSIVLYAIVLFQVESSPASFMVGHSHHNKRQQPSNTPQLILNVESEPHHGIEPSQIQRPSPPDFYFPVTASLFNFTCTIKHPQYRYKLIITREQTRKSTWFLCLTSIWTHLVFLTTKYT